ncbi:hypothetical protein J2T56_000682 [Natronobacillus azotifigens]
MKWYDYTEYKKPSVIKLNYVKIRVHQYKVKLQSVRVLVIPPLIVSPKG